LARFGTRKLSMTDVAEFAGVSRQTLYRYFPSMDDLLDAVAEDELRTFDAGVAKAVRDHPPGARLDAVLQFMSAGLSDDHLSAQLKCWRPTSLPSSVVALAVPRLSVQAVP
jgi:AcrR family transcriptional regulator